MDADFRGNNTFLKNDNARRGFTIGLGMIAGSLDVMTHESGAWGEGRGSDLILDASLDFATDVE